MEQLPQNFTGSTIRRLRNEHDLTQEMLSAKCAVAGYEISRGTLAKIEAGIRGVTDIELFVLALALGTSMEGLFPRQFPTRLKRGEFIREA